MKFSFISLVALLGLSTVLLSCQPQSNEKPEEPTLTLSTQMVMLDKKAQSSTTPQIIVTTNQEEWEVFANAEWLHTTQQGNGILISAEENTLGRDRSTNLLVLAGGKAKKVVVTQSAADIIFELSQDDIKVQNSGTELLVSIKTNSGEWKFESSDADWIKVEKFTSELVKITVAPNTAPEERTTTLYAKQGTILREIKVTQLGIGTRKYLLPYLSKSDDAYARMLHESNQGSFQYTDRFTIDEYDGSITQTYIFALASSVFEETIYIFIDETIDMIMMTAKDGTELKSQEYIDFLTDNGFEIEGEDEYGDYHGRHKELPFEFEVVINDAPALSSVKFYPIAKQDKPYPTFTTFPYDRSTYINDTEWNTDKIVAEEESEGRTIQLIESDYYEGVIEGIFSTLESASGETPYIRYFLMHDDEEDALFGSTRRLLNVWKDTSLAYFKDQGKYYFTDEFRALMANEGFKQLDPDGEFYINESKGLVIKPSILTMQERDYLSILYASAAELSMALEKDIDLFNEMVSKVTNR